MKKFIEIVMENVVLTVLKAINLMVLVYAADLDKK